MIASARGFSRRAIGGLALAVRSPADGWLAARQANEAEARFVAETVGLCLRLGLPCEEVAVVTPFRRHAALIRAHLQAQLPTATELPIIGTVERVQGLTVELVVVSLSAADASSIASLRRFRGLTP